MKSFSVRTVGRRETILSSSGPFVIFRTDNLILDFKNLSVREINAPLA